MLWFSSPYLGLYIEFIDHWKERGVINAPGRELFNGGRFPRDTGTNSASSGSMLAWQQLRAKTKSLTFPPLAVARYSIIQLGQLGRQWRERKCPIFETVAKGDSNPGSLDCESGILPLSYRAPVWVGTNLLENLLTRSNALVGSMTFAFNSAMYNDICFSLRFYCSCRNENIMSTVDISARIPRMPHCYSGYTLRQRLEADQYCGSTCQICVSVWHCMVTIRYALPDLRISGG